MTENTQKKATVLQAVKAIAVLVVICLVCGGLLALCNDLFYVSQAERDRRAEAKANKALTEVYPDFVEDTKFNKKLNKEFAVNASYGSVQRVLRSTDGTYIIEAEGIGGYGGSIKTLVVIDAEAKILAWKISDRGGETYYANVEQHMGEWYVGETISTDLPLLKHSQTTYTSTALNNAIKMASYYAMNVLNLGSNPEKDARSAIAALLDGTDYVDYEFEVNSDLDYRAALTDDANVLSYYFVGAKEGVSGILDAYVFNVDTEPQVVILQGNLGFDDRHEDAAVIVKSETIADELVLKVQDLSYNEYKIRKFVDGFKLAEYAEPNVDDANAKINFVCVGTDGSTVVNVTGKQGYEKGSVTINVVIKDGVIVSWNIESHVSQSFLADFILGDWDNVKNWFVGDTVDKTQPIVTPDAGAGKGTGATYSENAISRAVNAASQYVKNSVQQGGEN